MRADQLLVLRGIAATRSQAQRVLQAGGVLHRVGAAWKPLAKGANVDDACELQVLATDELKYASRGGLKLEGALAHTGLALHGCTVLDVGQSTGGFTDCALAHGAAQVVGIDVGHGQLLPRLRGDARVRCIEGVNARHLSAVEVAPHLPAAGFDVIVGDVSFISMTLVLPNLKPLLAPQGRVLFLVKPQFELQPQQIGAGGIVRDPALFSVVEQRVRTACAQAGLAVLDYFASSIEGGDGNCEFFVFAAHAQLKP